VAFAARKPAYVRSLKSCPTEQPSSNQVSRHTAEAAEEIVLLGACEERRLPTGAQVFNLPHKAPTGETACPTKT